MFTQITKGRIAVIFLLICTLAVSIVVRLFRLQIVEGEEYRQTSETRLLRSMPDKAPRGEILDRYGRPLVSNRMGFSVVFYREYIKQGDLNGLILKTIEAANQHEQTYFDTLPITKTVPFDFSFPDVAQDKVQERISAFLKEQKLEEGASADQVLAAMKERYEIEGDYTQQQLRDLIGVRYEMENRLFSTSTPYTFATDVSIELVTWIREQADDYPGIVITVEPIRQYVNGTMAAHLLGRTGIIYKEEYEQLKDKGYGMNDMIGKDGIEKVLEEYLKGTDGASSVEQNMQGKISKSVAVKEAIPGNYAVLTLDAEVQQTLEDSLKRTVDNLFGATAGSAVVTDVNSGEVIAMASYPTFDPETFNEDYNELLENPANPMWNRAISGQYAPGSTFKPLTAVAALEEGVATPNEQINDTGVYRYYEKSGYTPHCWIYDDTGSAHGMQNVTQALENSCNYYFYEVGRRLGIEKLAKYGRLFGLGEYTGLELPGEAKGIFASEEYRKELGTVWYPGDTLQAAIGQSDHLFTPVQLANYIATLANGGKRYKVHLVKDIKSYDDATSVLQIQPEVVANAEVSEETRQVVLDGMRKVSETGTASNVFSEFDIPVGGKTGSAEVSRGAANGLFVAFAPFDDPEIAISIVIEHGAHGNLAAPIARDVIEAYMEDNQVEDAVQPYNVLVQ